MTSQPLAVTAAVNDVPTAGRYGGGKGRPNRWLLWRWLMTSQPLTVTTVVNGTINRRGDNGTLDNGTLKT